jgi:hypothetical protein
MLRSTAWCTLAIGLLGGIAGAKASAETTKLPTAIADRTFVCVGTRFVQGTLIEPSLNPDYLTIHFGQDTASISTTGSTGKTELFCTEDRKCGVRISAAAIDLRVRIMMIDHRLAFDWQTGMADFGTGGLDGGQNFHGHCRSTKAADR